MVTALLLARFAEDQSAVVQTAMLAGASLYGIARRHLHPSDHGRGAERPVRERAPAEIAVIKLDSSGPTSYRRDLIRQLTTRKCRAVLISDLGIRIN